MVLLVVSAKTLGNVMTFPPALKGLSAPRGPACPTELYPARSVSRSNSLQGEAGCEHPSGPPTIRSGSWLLTDHWGRAAGNGERDCRKGIGYPRWGSTRRS